MLGLHEIISCCAKRAAHHLKETSLDLHLEHTPTCYSRLWIRCVVCKCISTFSYPCFCASSTKCKPLVSWLLKNTLWHFQNITRSSRLWSVHFSCMAGWLLYVTDRVFGIFFLKIVIRFTILFGDTSGTAILIIVKV